MTARPPDGPTCPECGGARRADNRYCSRACYWAAYRRAKPPCSVENCNEPPRSRGLCNKHRLRLKTTGTTSSTRDRTVLDRFWDAVDVRGPDECWPWTGELNNQGYGRFVVSHSPKRTRVLAHRFAYAQATEEDIEGQVVMHSCDNPPCCNPAHLRSGTQLDNMRDAMAKGRVNLDGLEIGWELRRRRQRAAA